MTRRKALPAGGGVAELYGDMTLQTLEDLVSFGGQAERLVQQGRAAYEGDEFLRLAAEGLIHRIGEAVQRLPEKFTDDHPEIAWRPMRGTRNIVAHNCDAIDHTIIWKAISEGLPRDVERMRSILLNQPG